MMNSVKVSGRHQKNFVREGSVERVSVPATFGGARAIFTLYVAGELTLEQMAAAIRALDAREPAAGCASQK